METTLFEIQQQLSQLATRKEQLEADNQALFLAKETLQGNPGTAASPRFPPFPSPRCRWWLNHEAAGGRQVTGGLLPLPLHC